MKCPLCRVKEVCVKCCGMNYCLFDYFCSQHIDHPERATITNESEFQKSWPLVESLVTQIKSNLLEQLYKIDGTSPEKKPEIIEKEPEPVINETQGEPKEIKSTPKKTKEVPKIVFGPLDTSDPYAVRKRAIDMFCAGLSVRYQEIYNKSVENDMMAKETIYNHSERFEDLLYAQYGNQTSEQYRNRVLDLYSCILKTPILHHIQDLFEHKVSEEQLIRMPALEWTQEQKENEETMYFLFHLKIKQTSDFSYTKAARPCPECGEDLYMKILRGNISSGLKGEIWGSKDTPILVIEYKCMKCHYISVEEE